MIQAVSSLIKDQQLEAARMPPQSVEAEQSVLGGLLLDNSAWDRIGDVVSEEDFYRADHRLIFQHIALLIQNNKPADALTVAESLERSARLAEAGGPAYIGTLALNTPSAANIRRYAEIVRERSIMRSLATIGTEIADSAYSPQGRDAGTLIDEAEARVFRIAETRAKTRQGFIKIDPILTETVERIDMLYSRENKNEVIGLPSGFVDLDRMTSGLQPGDLVIIAARPSMGKTTLAMNMVEHVALEAKKPVAVFSMEMSGAQLAMRMIGSVGRVDQHELRTGTFQESDWEKLTHTLGRLSETQIYIDDTAGLNALEMRSRTRRLHRQCAEHGGLALVVVDYLQLMSGTKSGGRDENRATEIAEISRSLKGLAKELKVPVIALSQLNRSVEQRQDKRPMMSDLRECVTGETLVMLADGRRVPIRELVDTQPDVWAITEERTLAVAKADKVWPVGRRLVFRVSLASGREVRATALHRLYGAQGWVRVEQLEPGDRLALARTMPEPQKPLHLPEHELVLLGHLIGDGSYLRHQPMRYTTASEENSEAVATAAARLGSTVTRRAGRGNRHQLVVAANGNRWHPSGVNRWLRELGIYGQRSYEKRLPEAVFRLGNEQVAILLRHLWATDGGISCRKPGGKGSARVYFSASSEGLARDVAALLLRFEIVARIRVVHHPRCRPTYTVDVSGAEHQLRFVERVGAFGPRRQPAEQLRIELAAAAGNPNADTVPVEMFSEFRAAMRERDISQRAMASMRGTSYGGTSHFRFAPSRAAAAHYAELPGDERSQAQATDALFWDRVVAIQAEAEEDVYDLSVPGPASWLADGIVSHNSGAIEQDADLILFIYRDEVYNPDSPRKGISEIIIAKQRNGPVGKIDLTFLGKYTRFENYAGGPAFGGAPEY